MQDRNIFLISITFFLFLGACAPMDETVVNTEIRGNRILNGKAVTTRTTNASKSMVIVEMVDAKNMIITRCSGALIGPQTVLTAAHCFDPDTVKALVARFVIHFENAYKLTQFPRLRFGSARLTHPAYSPSNTSLDRYLFDVAVLRFEGDIPPGFEAANIETDINANHGGKIATVLGYGRDVDYTGNSVNDNAPRPSVLRRGSMFIDADYLTSGPQYSLTGTSANQWICKGDSGGAQFIEEKGKTTLIGVTSSHIGPFFADKSRSCMGSAMAVKVSLVSEWVLKSKELLANASH